MSGKAEDDVHEDYCHNALTMRRVLKILAAVLAVLFVAAALAAVWLAAFGIRGIEIDLSRFVKEEQAGLFDNLSATVNLDFSRGAGGGIDVRAYGKILDWTYSGRANVRLGFFSAKAAADLALDETAWELHVELEASSLSEWEVTALMPDTAFDEKDAVLARMLERLPHPQIENLSFGGKAKMDAQIVKGAVDKVPRWGADFRLSDCSAGFELGGRQVLARGIRTGGGVSGIAGHMDVKPMFPRADLIEFAGFALTNVFASVRATETAFLLTEAGAETCGGEIKAYSVFLDPKRLTAGATLFLENIDAGEVMSHMSGFKGEADGRLNGKMAVFMKDGRELKLRDSYLRSIPGETGTVRIFDASAIVDNLAAAGVPQADTDNLSKVLADLDYSVLRIDLVREDDGFALALRLEGSATGGGKTVPVSFTVTFHGDLERLVNTGFKTLRKDQK